MPARRFPFSLLCFALATSSLYACYTSTEPGASPGGSDDDAGDGATGSGAEAGGAGRDASAGNDGGGTTQTSDLPCAIAAILATNCQSCHGTTPTMGAPMSLVTHADLAAPSPSKPSITVAASAVIRVSATRGAAGGE